MVARGPGRVGAPGLARQGFPLLSGATEGCGSGWGLEGHPEAAQAQRKRGRHPPAPYCGLSPATPS
eukprot:8445781-Alexandrium_andersonii.AAC.1